MSTWRERRLWPADQGRNGHAAAHCQRATGQLFHLWPSAFLPNPHLHCRSVVKTPLESIPLKGLASSGLSVSANALCSFLPSSLSRFPWTFVLYRHAASIRGHLSQPDGSSICRVICAVPCRWGLIIGPRLLLLMILPYFSIFTLVSFILSHLPP